MDKWLKKANNKRDKPTRVDAEGAAEADTAIVPSTSKKRMLGKKNVLIDTHTKKRTYKESYVQYGFTFIAENNEHLPLCLICHEVLASESQAGQVETTSSHQA